MTVHENPGGSHKALTSDIGKELQSYKRLGNHVKRYKFSNHFVHGKRVLELGCGYGFGAFFLRGYFEYVGVDVDADAISWAQKNVMNGTFLLLSDFLERFKEHSFDIVIAFEVIEHVDDPVEFLDTLKRYCMLNGKIIISTPNGYYSDHIKEKFKSEFHIDEYNISELKSLITKAGLIGIFYKEYRFDHLDSYWLQKKKDTTKEDQIETNKSKDKDTVSNNISFFQIGYKYFNTSIFWHIRKVNAFSINKSKLQFKGYDTIVAVLKNGKF